jgi:hypothetical protein
MTASEERDEQSTGASPLARDERMPVGVILERRKARNPWDDVIWRAVAVVPGAAATPAWSVAHEEPDATQYFAGTFTLELHPRETGLYRDNLTSPSPAVYVAMVRDPAAEPHGIVVRHVTLSPGDAEAYMDAVSSVDPVPMPDVLAAWLTDYVAAFHVDEVFRKRARKPYDPRKGVARGRGPGQHEPTDE